MKKVSLLFLFSVIAFMAATALTANIGSDFNSRIDIYGWPNEIARISYEKFTVTDISLNGLNIAINFGLTFCLVSAVRVLFLMMKINRKSSSTGHALKSHPYLQGK